jgi:hypothetical protein
MASPKPKPMRSSPRCPKGSNSSVLLSTSGTSKAEAGRTKHAAVRGDARPWYGAPQLGFESTNNNWSIPRSPRREISRRVNTPMSAASPAAVALANPRKRGRCVTMFDYLIVCAVSG